MQEPRLRITDGIGNLLQRSMGKPMLRKKCCRPVYDPGIDFGFGWSEHGRTLCSSCLALK